MDNPQIDPLTLALAERLNDEVRSNPQSPYAGKFVAIAHGQFVAVANDWDSLGRKLEEIESDPGQTFCLEVGRDYSEVHWI